MRTTHDLSQLQWNLTGWNPHYWRGNVSDESGLKQQPDVPAIAAAVPGSVQQALYRAGLLPDWNVKVNSRQCEWVENRHWIFETTLPAEWAAPARRGRKVLRCEGLDYEGLVLVNGRPAGNFCGSFVPHAFDLTPLLSEGQNRLSIVFTQPPRYLGQVHFTSQITQWKERFNYIWDWTPRLVQIGIWDRIFLSVDNDEAIEEFRACSDYQPEGSLGEVTIAARLCCGEAAQVEVRIGGDEGEIVRKKFPARMSFRETLTGLKVRPWLSNGSGEAALYQLRLRLLAGDGETLDEESRTVGFRCIEWKPCRGAPAGAEPWICSINGVDTFLQGFNWVPIRPNFADVTEEDYRTLLRTYRDLGTNLLRVWGGAVLERECFYRLCDEMGILVWQEFPLSSSGCDNWPPQEAQAIAEMKQIVTSYIARRQHHPSLLLWCGGNELMGAKQQGKPGTGRPVDTSHPMIAMMAETVAEWDPTRRFLPTSASGPRFNAAAKDFGKGIHHDVHGPWNHIGPLADAWAYWDGDDSLFRSETGMPGASSAAIIRRYGEELALPGTRSNAYWGHCGGWWIQWDEYLAEGGKGDDLEAYVRWSQERQAQILAHAAKRCKQRFPAIGGIVIWMGHDCYPCPVNTAVIDFSGQPKPAALALKAVFRVGNSGVAAKSQ